MTTQPANISVTDPVSGAIERVRQVLFRPFDLGRWFTIGFCAWLAFLGERGASGGNFGGGNHHSGDFHQAVDHAREFALQNLWWIAPVVVIAATLAFALWVLLVWLNSRGKFMFLHCVALNKAEVREPWNRFASAANSLFQFRIVLGLIGMVLTLPALAFVGFSIFRMCYFGGWNFAGVMVVIGVGLAMVLIGILFALIRKLTTDFVVPIMFIRQKRCLEAWSEYRHLMAANLWHFVLYILFQIVLSLAIGAIVLTIVIFTCCIAGCFLAIPYIGTVLFLPVLVFSRAYSLCYFAQYGPEYNVFPPPARAI